jgi:hypothetical protein
MILSQRYTFCQYLDKVTNLMIEISALFYLVRYFNGGVIMTGIISVGEGCRRALSADGLISENVKIRRIALLQRDVSRVGQALVLGLGTGYASWIYNDPYRADDESLPWTFYAVSGSLAATTLGALTAFRIQRWCRNLKQAESWIVHPIIAVFGSATGFTFSVLIAGICADKISNSDLAKYFKNVTLLEQWYRTREKLEDTCYQNVFDKRFNFTDPSCTICIKQDHQLKPQFYQAIFVENFSTFICHGSLSIWAKNYTDLSSTDLWPCAETGFNDIELLPDGGWRAFVSEQLNIWPPMSVLFYPYNSSCFLAEGSGTWVDGQPVLDLCENMEEYQWNPEAVCTTPAWNHFVTNFSAEYNAPKPNATLEPSSLQVKALIDDGGFDRQFFGGIGFMSSMVTLIWLIFPQIKKCRRAKQAPAQEMEVS